MEYRKLGRSGLDVSVIGLGGNTFGWGCDRAQSADVIAAARDLGINTIDTADVYGGPGVSEDYVGSAIRGEREMQNSIRPMRTGFCGPTTHGPRLLQIWNPDREASDPNARRTARAAAIDAFLREDAPR